jgi:autotransporter-associated beta strand protein
LLKGLDKGQILRNVYATTPSFNQVNTMKSLFNSFLGKIALREPVARIVLSGALLLLAAGMSARAADPIPHVFQNNTGMSSSQIFIQFLNSTSTVTGTYSNVFGSNQPLQANTAYSLDQITGADGIAKVHLTNFSGGRIFVNFGPYGLQGMGPGYTPAAQNPNDPNYSTRYQYFEQTIVPEGAGTAIYTDLSYIDFTAISLSMSAVYASNGQVNTNVQNPNQITANTQRLVDAAYAQSGTNTVAPSYPPNPTPPNPTANPAAIIPGGASPTLPNAEFARVISPQFSAAGVYHDFTAYLTSLTGNNTSVHLAGTYVGTGTQPTGNISTQGQTYDFTGTFSGNVTTGGITLTAGPLSGNASVSWLGNSTASGVGSNATIFIPYASLNSQDGIYGNNGNYVISSPSYSANQTGISNDVWGQVVGDLYAGLSFGYVGSSVAFGNSTIGALASSQWWASGESNLNKGTYLPDGTQVFYKDTPAGKKIYFSDVQSNPLFYNGYAASLTGGNQSLTTGYGFPLQDRLGNNLLYYNTAGNGTTGTQVMLTINPDGTAALPTGIWSGNATNGQWGTAGNWSGNAVPGGNASVQFVGNHTQTVTVDTGTNRSVAGIAFNYAAGNFTLANNTITLTGDVVNSSSKNQTINSNLVLGSNSTVTAAFGNLVFGGAIALKNSASQNNTLTFSGTQNSTVSGVISDGNGTGGALVKKGTGTLTLNGNNTFTGGLRHEAGTVVLGSDQAAGNGTLALGKAGAADAILQAAGGNRTLANPLVISGNTTFSGNYGLTFNGNVTLAASAIPSGNFTAFTVTNSADVDFSGAIGETVLGTGNTFTKAGAGNMTFSGNSANTFTGGLAVNEGTLNLNKSSGFAYGGNLTVGDGTGSAGSAVVRMQASNQAPGTLVTINTDGELDLQTFNASAGNLTMTGGSVTGTGILTLAAGSMVQFTGGGNATATISSGLALTGSSTFNIQNNAAATGMSVSGPLSGNASLTKEGSGSLALLGGNNTNTGSVTITGGILQTTSMNVNLTINGGALSPGAPGSITAMSVANLVASSGNQTGAFLMDLGGGTFSDSVNVTGTGIINLGNATSFLFKGAGITANASATYTLVTGNKTSWQAPLSTTPHFSFASIDIPGLTGTFAYDGNGTLTFIALAGVTKTWSGGDGNWTTGASWVGGLVPSPGADLLFGTSGQTTIATVSNQTTGAITFLTGADAFTFNGNTIILGGNLSNNSTNTQMFNSAIALNADRTISANQGNLVFGDVALSNIGALPGVLTIAGSQNTTINGTISDGPASGGSLVKTGAGTLTLNGTNTFNGTLTIIEGVVQAISGNAIGSGAGGVGTNQGSNSLIFAGGTLQATGDIISSQHRYLLMQSTGIIDTNGQNVTINGTIQGPGGLTKHGGGNLTLQQTVDANTYSGVTTVGGGSLVMKAPLVLGSTTNGTVVQSGGSLVIAYTGNVTGESLTLNGTGDGGQGALRLLSGQQATWNGTVGLTGNASIRAGDSSTLTLSQAVNVGNYTLTIGGNTSSAAPTEVLTGALSGSGGLTKTGNGTVSLSGDGTGYSGSTDIQGGVLNLIGTTALGNSTSTVTVASGATLQLQSQAQAKNTQGPDQGQQMAFASLEIAGSGVVVGSASVGAINNNTTYANTVGGDVSLTGDALVHSSSGLLTLTGNISLHSHTLTTSSNSVPITLAGLVSGAGGITTNATGSGGLVLSGNNSYSGGTTVADNTYVTAASNNALGSGNVTVVSGGSLQFQGGINMATGNITVGGVGYNAGGALLNVSGNNTYGGGISLSSETTLASNNGTLSLTGALGGAGIQNLIIQGPGIVYVAGAVSNVTQVNISSGTFASGNMSSTQVNLGPSAGSGSGTPTYSPGNVNNIETVTLGNLITSGNATLLMDLGAADASDKIVTNGAPNLGTGIAFFFNDSGFSGSGNFTLVTNTTGGIGGNVPIDQLTFKTNISGLSGTFSYSSPVPYTLQFQASTSSAVWNDAAGTGQWGSNGNWALGATPAGGSAVSFTSANSTTIDTQTNRLAGDITFQAGSAALTLSNNTITTYGTIRNQSGVVQTISSGLVISGNASVDAASGNLVISGAVGLGNSTRLTFTGGNNTTVGGGISGGSSSELVKTGSGTLTLTGNNSFAGRTTINAGTLVLNGSMSTGNDIMVSANGTLAGSGTAAGQVTVAGTLSPGNSPGTFSSGSQVWLDGGGFNWQLHDAAGAAGTGYDTLAITGTLDLTNLTASGFAINLWTLSAVGPDSNGNAINFVATNNYSWTLATTTGGITGFSAGDFHIHVAANNGAAGFSNLVSGAFSVSMSGNNLQLNYTAVPEPATWVLLSVSGLLLVWRSVRRKKAATGR